MLNNLGFLDKDGWPQKTEFKKAFDYIDNYWQDLARFNPKNTDTLFGLPRPYIVPANQHGNFRFNEQYYWDSYFISLGLISCGKNEFAEGMLENLFYMFKRLKMIPNASRLYMTSRSQPPILTTYILLIYQANKKSLEWLKTSIKIAEEEYLSVWMSEVHPHWHYIHKGLSRYYDANVLHDLAEAESGWDMTPRFDRKALDYLPVDLNCLLYKYELDFAIVADLLGDKPYSEMWRERAESRKKVINDLMWNKNHKFYFDYNYQKGSLGSVWSLAAYYSMWLGMASETQAKDLVKHLGRFNCNGGLSTTNKTLIDINLFGSLKTQWAYPNGWAPLHYIVIEGLNNYGYEKEALTIAKKWLITNLNWFKSNGEFLEKYNMSEPNKIPQEGVYPTQTGFGWTNGVFARLVKEYGLV